jgi:hypothetical protein
MKNRRIIATIPAPINLFAYWQDSRGHNRRDRVALLAHIEDNDGQWITALVPGGFGCLEFVEDIAEEACLGWPEDDPEHFAGQ